GRPRHPSDLPDHDAIDFWDAAHGRAYEWELRRGNDVLPVSVQTRLMTSDAPTMLSACLSGAGIAQVLEFATREHVRDGRLIDLFPDWSDELFPLYAIYPSRQYRTAKVRGF
ncbi:LysR substrate-binding domain-containing protein, partial [Mesorhizobium sp. M8A.F.Ca.ET.182.01.1.1]